MAREGIDSVDLAYFGRVDPAIYGIKYRPLLKTISHRYVVISTNLLWGRMYFLGGTRTGPTNRDYYAAFRRLKPKTILGYSLYVFDLKAQSPSGACRKTPSTAFRGPGRLNGTEAVVYSATGRARYFAGAPPDTFGVSSNGPLFAAAAIALAQRSRTSSWARRR